MIKKRNASILLACVMAIVGYASCKNDKSELVYPADSTIACDTSNVRLSTSITTVLAAQCYSCHSSSIANGGVVLDTYSGLTAQVSNGHLLSAIEQDGTVQPMPQGGSKLSDCEINQIKAWINAGYPNN